MPTKAEAQQAISELIDLESLTVATLQEKLLTVLDYINSNSISFKGVGDDEVDIPTPEVPDETFIVKRTAVYSVNSITKYERILAESSGEIVTKLLEGNTNIALSTSAGLGGVVMLAGDTTLSLNIAGGVGSEKALEGATTLSFTATGDMPPDPAITWNGPPTITGATGDFDLIETSEAVFIMIEASGLTKTTTDLVRLRFRANAGAWIESTNLYQVDGFSDRYCGQCGLVDGQISSGDTIDVELVERALIGSQIEVANTQSKSIVTRNRTLPTGSRTVNVSTTSGLVNAINNVIAGDRIELASGTYSYSGDQFNSKTGIDDITIACLSGQAIIDGTITDTYTWTLQGDGTWTTTDIANPDDIMYLWVDTSPIHRFNSLANLNTRKNGFFVTGSTVHIRIDLQTGNRNPNSYTITASQAQYGFRFSTCDRLYFQNITFRCISKLNTGTGGTKPQAAVLQDCVDLTMDNVRLEMVGRGLQMNGDMSGMTRRNCKAITDSTYLNGTLTKDGGNRYWGQEECNVFWAEGTTPTRSGVEILDEILDGGPNTILQDGAGAFSRPADRVQSAVSWRRSEFRNCIGGFELDGTQCNFLCTDTVVHGLLTISLAPFHYGPAVFYNCHVQFGWIPGEETRRVTKEGVHFSFGSPPHIGGGTLRLLHCTIVGKVFGENGAHTQDNQLSTQGGASNMGSYASYQIEDTYPHNDVEITNCIFDMATQDGHSNNPIGWIFPWLPGSGSNGLDSDQDGLVWKRIMVITATNNNNNAPFFEENDGQSVAEIQVKYPSRFDDVIVAVPNFDSNRIAQNVEADTVDTITGINLPKMGANIPYTFNL